MKALRRFFQNVDTEKVLVRIKMPEQVKLKFMMEPYKVYRMDINSLQPLYDAIEEAYKDQPDKWISVEYKSLKNELDSLAQFFSSTLLDLWRCFSSCYAS